MRVKSGVGMVTGKGGSGGGGEQRLKKRLTALTCFHFTH